MLHIVLTTAFENVGKADDIAVDVGKRVFDGVPYASLRGKIYDTVWLITFESIFDGLSVTQIKAQMRVISMICMPR